MTTRRQTAITGTQSTTSTQCPRCPAATAPMSDNAPTNSAATVTKYPTQLSRHR
ncbi:hypothetical protein [Nocardia concava]|uniref:hypothetical protein n=1 Tax=Nocardia concava TaxID=257281 RepID=UPI0012F90DDC|nr:hypothetical protein [Nocardia concava]